MKQSREEIAHNDALKLIEDSLRGKEVNQTALSTAERLLGNVFLSLSLQNIDRIKRVNRLSKWTGEDKQ